MWSASAFEHATWSLRQPADGGRGDQVEYGGVGSNQEWVRTVPIPRSGEKM